jgi:hypothetical protein
MGKVKAAPTTSALITTAGVAPRSHTRADVLLYGASKSPRPKSDEGDGRGDRSREPKKDRRQGESKPKRVPKLKSGLL